MTVAVIVAAGRGTRMGPGRDKLFLEVSGRPVVAHAWAAFDQSPEIESIVVVVRAGMESAFRELHRSSGFCKPFLVVAGGAERQDSVWNGLQALGPEVQYVAIHDGARPCLSQGLIRRTLEAARRAGAAVAARRVTDTIKESDGGSRILRTIDRTRLWAVQTPQAFRLGLIRDALHRIRRDGLVVTDDTAACEAVGISVELVESAELNPKVTTPDDLPWVDLWLRRGQTAANLESLTY